VINTDTASTQHGGRDHKFVSCCVPAMRAHDKSEH